MNKLKITSAEMVRAARARITEIETDELIQQLDDPSLLIVDIRDIRERQKTGFIPGSFHAPRGMLEFWIDPDSPYAKEEFRSGKKFVFFCAGGMRSALATKIAKDMG
ncbi:MAG: rhodanese-like domain-containing protein, partial [Pseudomonadota bacterium]|nr:rhodanese-like domain-containing protein [Pseudomonadota bacterium]